MVIFLSENIDGLKEFENALLGRSLNQWIRESLKSNKQKVYLGLPRFKLEASFELADVHKSLGIKDAFSPSADFSGIDGAKDLFISQVIHKAVVEVNERGTEAATATAMVMGTAIAFEPEPAEFITDHPFVFAIVEKGKDAVLFMDRVVNPNRVE